MSIVITSLLKLSAVALTPEDRDTFEADSVLKDNRLSDGEISALRIAMTERPYCRLELIEMRYRTYDVCFAAVRSNVSNIAHARRDAGKLLVPYCVANDSGYSYYPFVEDRDKNATFALDVFRSTRCPLSTGLLLTSTPRQLFVDSEDLCVAALMRAARESIYLATDVNRFVKIAGIDALTDAVCLKVLNNILLHGDYEPFNLFRSEIKSVTDFESIVSAIDYSGKWLCKTYKVREYRYDNNIELVEPIVRHYDVVRSSRTFIKLKASKNS